jgi:hypothetical protein
MSNKVVEHLLYICYIKTTSRVGPQPQDLREGCS